MAKVDKVPLRIGFGSSPHLFYYECLACKKSPQGNSGLTLFEVTEISEMIEIIKI